MNLVEIIKANGIFFTLVFSLASLVSVTLVVWKIFKNMHANVDFDKFISQLEQELEAGGGKQAFEYCDRLSVETHQVMPKLFAAAFRHGHQGMIAARDAMADTLETEIMPSLHSLLPHILLLAKVAPMLGLLGTVVGMIQAFGKMAGQTRINPQDLSSDIGMALYTTAEGLFIAIPLIFAYTLFLERVRRFEVDLQRGSQVALRMLPRVFGRQGN